MVTLSESTKREQREKAGERRRAQASVGRGMEGPDSSAKGTTDVWAGVRRVRSWSCSSARASRGAVLESTLGEAGLHALEEEVLHGGRSEVNGDARPSAVCQVVGFLVKLLCARLRLQSGAAVKVLLEKDGNRSLARWLHDGSGVSAAQGLASWLGDLANMEQHLIKAFESDSSHDGLLLVVSMLADGLVSTCGETRARTTALLWRFMFVGTQDERVGDVLLDWLCCDESFGLNYCVVGASLEPFSEDTGRLVDVLLRVLGDKLYQLFSRALLRVGVSSGKVAEEGGQYQPVCQYFRFCQVLLWHGAAHCVTHATLVHAKVVDCVLDLALHVLELLLARATGGLSLPPGLRLCCSCGKGECCMSAGLDLLQMLGERFADEFASLQAPSRLTQLITTHLDSWVADSGSSSDDDSNDDDAGESLVAVDVRVQRLRTADRLIHVFFRSAPTAMGTSDPSGRAFIDATFALVNKVRTENIELTVRVCQGLARFFDAELQQPPRLAIPVGHTLSCLCDLLANEGDDALFVALLGAARVVLAFADEEVLVGLCESLAPRCLLSYPASGGQEAPTLATTAAAEVMLTMLATAEFGTQPQMRAFRAGFLRDCLSDLERKHEVSQAALSLATERRRLQKAQAQEAARRSEKVTMGYAGKLHKLEHSPRRQSRRPDIGACKCLQTPQDKALANIVKTLVFFELQGEGPNAAGALGQGGLVDLLLWSKCPEIQNILDQARALQQHCASGPVKLAPLGPAGPVVFQDDDTTADESSGPPRQQQLGPLVASIPCDNEAGSSRKSSSGNSSSRNSSSRKQAVTQAQAPPRPSPRTGSRTSPHGSPRTSPRQLQALNSKVKRELAETELRGKERRAQQAAAAELEAAQELEKAQRLRDNFAEQRHRRRQKLEVAQREKMRSQEIQKEYLDLKDTGDASVEREFEARVAEQVAAWNGEPHITRATADFVFATTAPYIDALRRVFFLYSAQEQTHGGSFESTMLDSEMLCSKEWLACLRDFDIVPTAMHANGALEVFTKRNNGHPIQYLDFLVALWEVTEDSAAAAHLWTSSGFYSITSCRSPDLVKPGWFASRRGKASDRPGSCPATRFHVVCEHMRRTSARVPHLESAIGVWPTCDRVFDAGPDFVDSINPHVTIALEIVQDVLSAALGGGSRLLIDTSKDDPPFLRCPEPRSPKSAALHCGSAGLATLAAPKRPVAMPAATVEASAAKAAPFPAWLRKQKRAAPNPPIPADQVLDFEACARVLWRVIGQVETRAHAPKLTDSIEKGARLYETKARAHFEREKLLRNGEHEKEKLRRNRLAYEKEKARIVEKAQGARDARQLERERKEKLEAEREAAREQQREERQRLNHAKLQLRLLKKSMKTNKAAAAAVAAAASGKPAVDKAGELGGGSKTVKTKKIKEDREPSKAKPSATTGPSPDKGEEQPAASAAVAAAKEPEADAHASPAAAAVATERQPGPEAKAEGQAEDDDAPRQADAQVEEKAAEKVAADQEQGLKPGRKDDEDKQSDAGGAAAAETAVVPAAVAEEQPEEKG